MSLTTTVQIEIEPSENNLVECFMYIKLSIPLRRKCTCKNFNIVECYLNNFLKTYKGFYDKVFL